MIARLAVAVEFQGQGVGEQLLDYIKEMALEPPPYEGSIETRERSMRFDLGPLSSEPAGGTR